MADFTLCTYSKSEIFRLEILVHCPLSLNSSAAKKCPCRKRLYLPGDLRVLSCQYPSDYRGNPIRNPEGLSRNLTISAKVRDQEKRKSKKKQEKPVMTADSQQQKNEAAAEANSAKDQQPAPALRPTLSSALSSTTTVWSKVNDVVAFIQGFGSIIADSRMFGCSNPAQGKILAAACLFENRNPIELMRVYYIISGRLSMRADAMLAEFEARGGRFKIIKREDDVAEIELKKDGEKFRFSFTWEEAQSEDYVYTKEALSGAVKRVAADGKTVNPKALKDNWSTPRRRRQMLWARCISDAVRAFDPRVNAGYYTPEESDIIDAQFSPVLDDIGSPAAAKESPWQSGSAQAQKTTESAPGGATTTAAPAAEQKATTPQHKQAADSDKQPEGEGAKGMVVEPPTQSAEDRKIDFIKRMALAKKELIALGGYSEEKYREFLNKHGVTSAKDLSLSVVEDAMCRLEKALHATKQRKEAVETVEKSLGQGN